MRRVAITIISCIVFIQAAFAQSDRSTRNNFGSNRRCRRQMLDSNQNLSTGVICIAASNHW